MPGRTKHSLIEVQKVYHPMLNLKLPDFIPVCIDPAF